MKHRRVRITINGTGFAGDYTARVYGMIPHKNGVSLELAGVMSGHLGNARLFARRFNIPKAYESHADMLEAVKPDIDNVASANFTHGEYTK